MTADEALLIADQFDEVPAMQVLAAEVRMLRERIENIEAAYEWLSREVPR